MAQRSRLPTGHHYDVDHLDPARDETAHLFCASGQHCRDALALVGAAGGFMALGAISFKLGLRKYASGAVWTRA